MIKTKPDNRCSKKDMQPIQYYGVGRSRRKKKSIIRWRQDLLDDVNFPHIQMHIQTHTHIAEDNNWKWAMHIQTHDLFHYFSNNVNIQDGGKPYILPE